MDADAAAASQFIKFIGVKLVKPEPIAAPLKAPDQASPIESKPADSEAEFRKRYDAELDAIIEMERHPDLFDESAAGMENVKRVVDWVTQRGDYVSRANVSEAIRALKGELTPVRKPEPAPEPKPMMTAKEATQLVKEFQKLNPAPPPPPPPPAPVDELPPVPPYMLSERNALRTKSDIARLGSRYSEFYRSKHGDMFKKRVDAILRRGI